MGQNRNGTRQLSWRGQRSPVDEFVRTLAAGPVVSSRQRPSSTASRHVGGAPMVAETPVQNSHRSLSVTLTTGPPHPGLIDLTQWPESVIESDVGCKEKSKLVDETTEELLARKLKLAEFVILPNDTLTYRFLKRALDIVGAVVLLVFTAPLMLALVVLIRRDSSGPAFFKQQRVSRNGRHFTFIKFRTMYVDARERFPDYYVTLDHTAHNDDVFYKVADDPRNTPFGRWLRRTTLDELPNLVNVLKGDISLVGPRPDLPELVCRYSAIELSCLLTKAGMTGSAQTKGRSLLTVRERLRLDLNYVSHQSLWLDLKILGRTAFVVLLRRGAF